MFRDLVNSKGNSDVTLAKDHSAAFAKIHRKRIRQFEKSSNDWWFPKLFHFTIQKEFNDKNLCDSYPPKEPFIS